MVEFKYWPLIRHIYALVLLWKAIWRGAFIWDARFKEEYDNVPGYKEEYENAKKLWENKK